MDLEKGSVNVSRMVQEVNLLRAIPNHDNILNLRASFTEGPLSGVEERVRGWGGGGGGI